MKKFVFSLERMLVFKTQNLEKEKGTLGRMLGERDQLETEKAALWDRLLKAGEDMALKEARGTTGFELKACYAILASGKIRLEEMEKELDGMKTRIEKQQQAVVEASREVKKLEKLKETQLEDYRLSEAKEQQEIIAEHVAGEFVRKGGS